METKDNITRLLEMLENPEAYSEQEIRDIIDSDEETRRAYRLMVAARQGYHHQHPNSVDVEAAWRRLMGRTDFFNYRKIAASLIGFLFVSGIAFAAIHVARRNVGGSLKSPAHETQISNTRQSAVATDIAATDTTAVQPVVFDNVPLEKMLPEIAAYYSGTESLAVTFQNDEARQFRFYFVWDSTKGIEEVIADLNQFERLRVTLEDHQIIVE